ncbi:MAG: xanthine dehydrogenase accessory protein XdhC [Polaromonas sp.]|nr:xanthine dehydrogenase accessory protein XdhC [Polaromonas sp.]
MASLHNEPAVLVQITATEGSVPRETGTWMAVFSGEVVGTIGGGHLEHQAIAAARKRLQGLPGDELSRVVLGPSLGQCCGGVVHLRFETVGAEDASALGMRLGDNLWPVALFGGGHVGHALVEVLSTLPFALTWIDSRDGIFPEVVPEQVICEQSDPVQRAVPFLAPGSRVLIMSFSHAEDLDIVAECLKRQREKGDLPYIGLIGSKTKWATFRHRLAARGFSDQELAQVTCPIGLPRIKGKEPEVIAVSVAAQLLQGTVA